MKRLHTVVVVLLMTSFSYGQEKFAPMVRAGLNFANVTDIDGKTRTDFYLGAAASLRLGKIYSMQPEINYSRQGINQVKSSEDLFYDGETLTGDFNNIQLHYVGFHLINKFHIQDFNIFIGPGLDFSVNSNLDYIANTDIVINFGLGYDITKNIGVEARFKQGILDVYDSATFLFISVNERFNTVFSVGGYYRF